MSTFNASLKKNLARALVGAALVGAVAATVPVANAAGGGFSASDGQWQQTLDRYNGAGLSNHQGYRTITVPPVAQPAPNVPR